MMRRKFSSATQYCLFVLAVLLVTSAPARGHVQLDIPNGGEVLSAGSVFTVQWHIQIAHAQLNWDLWYSTTGPTGPWIPIATDIPPGSQLDGSIHTYDWTVPNTPSNLVRVRVQMDNAGVDYIDISDADLSIEAAPVPTVSQWGLIIMALLLATGGTVACARRCRVA